MAAYGKARRTITDHRLPANVFKKTFASNDILAKFMGFLIRDTVMSPTMAGKLVAVCDDTLYHGRITISDPSQGKKGCFGAFIIQQDKNAVDIEFHSARYGRPRFPRNVGRKC